MTAAPPEPLGGSKKTSPQPRKPLQVWHMGTKPLLQAGVMADATPELEYGVLFPPHLAWGITTRSEGPKGLSQPNSSCDKDRGGVI